MNITDSLNHHAGYYLLLTIYALFSGACSPPVVHQWDQGFQPDTSSWVHVSEVITGDKIRTLDGQIVQYLGIQAPQPGEPFFEEARQANLWLLRDGKAVLQFVTADNIEQPQAYVFAMYSPMKGVFCFVNKELLQYGYAKVADKPSDHKYRKEFVELQEQAVKSQLGRWQRTSKTKTDENL